MLRYLRILAPLILGSFSSAGAFDFPDFQVVSGNQSARASIDFKIVTIDNEIFVQYKLCNLKTTSSGLITNIDTVKSKKLVTREIQESSVILSDEDLKAFYQSLRDYGNQSGWLVHPETPWIYDSENGILCAYFMDTNSPTKDDYSPSRFAISLDGTAYMHFDPSMEGNFMSDDLGYRDVVLVQKGIPLAILILLSDGLASGLIWKFAPEISRVSAFQKIAVTLSVAPVAQRYGSEPVDRIITDLSREANDEESAWKFLSAQYHFRTQPFTTIEFFAPSLELRNATTGMAVLPSNVNILDFASQMKQMITVPRRYIPFTYETFNYLIHPRERYSGFVDLSFYRETPYRVDKVDPNSTWINVWN